MKKVTRTIVLLLLAALMLFGVAGCGGSSAAPSATPSATPAPSATPTPEKTYIIYSDNAFAPFEYYDEATKQYVGVDMDILAAVAEDQGFKYEVKNEGFDASMGAVQSGQADGMIAGMTIKPARLETFDFSDGYFEDGQIMVVAAKSKVTKLEDLKGLTVAAKTSTVGAEYAESVAAQYGFTIQYYDDSPTMYTAVINGNNAACFEDRSVVGWAIMEESLALKTIGEVINPGSYGFAVKKGTNADLIAMFNAGLASIKKSGKYDEILAKYGY